MKAMQSQERGSAGQLPLRRATNDDIRVNAHW